MVSINWLSKANEITLLSSNEQTGTEGDELTVTTDLKKVF